VNCETGWARGGLAGFLFVGFPKHRRGSSVMPTIAIVLVAIVVLGFLLLSSTIKIVQEYESGVIFRLGRPAPLR